MSQLNELINKCHEIALEKGWWLAGDRPFGELMALVHSEVSEAFEEFRDGKNLRDITIKDNKPEGIPIEFADILIRVFDICGRYEIDIEKALEVKMGYNETRPHRHGGKLV